MRTPVNHQPYYHRAVILFTATRDVPQRELQRTLNLVKLPGYVAGTLEVEEVGAEPGDPADLL